MSFPYEPGSNSYFLKQTPPKEIFIPNMFNMSGFRLPTLQQMPCKTVNEITYPSARVSNIPEMSGFKSVLFGSGDKVLNEYRLFYNKQFPLNNPILIPTPTYFF